MNFRVGGLFSKKVQKVQCALNVASETLGERGWGEKGKNAQDTKSLTFLP